MLKKGVSWGRYLGKSLWFMNSELQSEPAFALHFRERFFSFEEICSPS